MSSDRERIIEFDASTSIPADGWFAIDSTTEGTRKIQKSAIIGSGSLDTTSQEVIGAINEVNQRAATIDSMTQDEYDDLPSTKESDNVPRFITDGVPTFDETLWNKVGTDPLDTTAQDCSGAINEIKSSLSNKANKSWTQILNETAPSRAYDQTKNLATGKKFSDFNELMFVMMNANNLRVMGTTVVPIEVFTNGAAYVLGCGDIGASYLYNAVFIYVSDTSTEIAITANSGNPIASYVFRIMAR